MQRSYMPSDAPFAAPSSFTLGPPQVYAAFLVFFFLAPTFSGVLRLSGGGLYLGEMFQAFYAAAVLTLLALLMRRRRIKRAQLLAPVLISLFFLFLICVAALRDASRLVPSDLFELYKPIFAAVAFIACVLVKWSDDDVEHVARAYLLVITAIAMYGIFEAVGGETAHRLSVLLYRSDRGVLVGKATGPFGVTYFLAAFMLFGFLFSGVCFLYQRKLRYLIVALASLATLFLSQSRAGVLAFVAVLFCVCLFYGFYGPFRYKLLVYLAAAAGLLGVVAAFDRLFSSMERLPYLHAGIARLIARGVDPEGVGSFNERYRQLLFAVDAQDALPLVGVGIGKGYARLLESYYALYLFRYGALGIAVSIVIFAVFFVASLRAYKGALEQGRLRNACFFLALHLWMYALPVLSLAGAIHDQVKFAVFFYGSLGLMISYNAGRRRRNAGMLAQPVERSRGLEVNPARAFVPPGLRSP